MQEPRRSKNVTLKDVANLAGVSVATASKALNGRGDVHAETRRRVQETAERLSFRPNSLAQNLLSGRSGTIGLITNDLQGRFSIPILIGTEDAVGAGKMSILLCDTHDDPIRESYHLQALLGRNVDGLIVVGSRTDPRPSLGQDLPVPVVYVYAPSDNPEDLSLVPDNVRAGREATEHLLSIGRSNIVHIASDPTYAAAHDRVEGVNQALASAGMSVDGGRTLLGAWSEEWGRGGTRTLLSRYEGIDAIVCGSDQIARGALDALRELGIEVPTDIAVVSFDNWEILSTAARPPLSSVDMNFEALGRTAAKRIFDALDGGMGSGVVTQPCRLIVRGSTIEHG